MIVGLQSYLFSGAIYVLKSGEMPFKITSKLLALREETLFGVCVVTVLGVIAGLSGFMIFWGSNAFHGIAVIRPLLDILYWLLSVLMFAFGLIQIHLFKRFQGQSK